MSGENEVTHSEPRCCQDTSCCTNVPLSETLASAHVFSAPGQTARGSTDLTQVQLVTYM